MVHVYKFSRIKNVGLCSIWVFSWQFISVKIYRKKSAAHEHNHSDMFLLKRVRCNVGNDLVWFISMEVLFSHRWSFGKDKQLANAFLFCIYARNFGKYLFEHAAIPKICSTRDAFLQIYYIFTEHLFWRTQLVNCFQNRCFLWICVLVNPQKNVLELLW